MKNKQTATPASSPGLERAAYTVNEFLDINPIGRTKFYGEVKAGRIKIVKVGRKTLVTTKPAEWLARLAGEDA